ncbi:hypothetical protein SZN_35177 [Streptomyces zinciresistens K42]|uniref:Uncharacterized protein n=1 Tax=Streptomyces zinciresistens K42 TaxID=700597 RepID=G2GND0_9ACTN|nr:hypothetical protein [Streptomyces zinciresistens]EGX54984.1 hypothetical protein SZN_35177 [Streptomyces zinciresistens K42]
MAREELTRLTGNGNGNCNNDACLNVYPTASGSFVVQGAARVLGAGEFIPYGAHPVLLAQTTVWGALRVESSTR